MFQALIISFLFISIKSYQVKTIDNVCNYTLYKYDHNTETCLSNQCNQYIDPYSIMVKPNNCKTELLYLSFSSYKNFSSFINRLEWKLGDLFPSRLNDKIRLLRIYINYIDSDDKPIDYIELIRLGINIDLYELFIKNIKNNNHVHGSIHYDTNYPQWYIIKVEFICNSLMTYNDNRCSIKIVSPSSFVLHNTLFTTVENFPLINDKYSSSLTSFPNQASFKQNQISIYLLLIILISILIIIILLIISILIYKKIIKKQCSSMDLTTISTTRRSSSIPSLSNGLDVKSSSIIPENVHHTDQMLDPIKSLDYRRHTKNQFTSKLNDIYDRISLDNHSLFGQQHFTPISSSFRF